MSGQLVKMSIEAYNNADFSGSPFSTYTLMFNPASYSGKLGLAYEDDKTFGANKRPAKFNRVDPEHFDLVFTVDGTGVGAAVSGRGGLVDVTADLARFRKTTQDYISESTGKTADKFKNPPYCKISWGTLVFKGVLSSSSVSYTLFSPQGIPLRAEVTAKFTESTNVSACQEKSPQKRLKVTGTDSVPGLCHASGGSIHDFEAVVILNSLRNFRKLKSGLRLKI